MNAPGRPRGLPLLAVVLLLFVLVALVARAGPYTERPREPTTATATSAAPEAGLTIAPDDELADRITRDARGLGTLPPLQVLSTVIFAVMILLAVIAVLVVLGALPRPRFSRRRASAGAAGGTDPGRGPGPELADAVDHALDVVEQGQAREAVVACWLLMIRAATESGSPPRASETSREYAERLSAEQLVSPRPLSRLGELYREARFSQHPVGGDLRAEARRALGVLQSELRSGVRL